jgi:hypothetical protein
LLLNVGGNFINIVLTESIKSYVVEGCGGVIEFGVAIRYLSTESTSHCEIEKLKKSKKLFEKDKPQKLKKEKEIVDDNEMNRGRDTLLASFKVRNSLILKTF